MKARVLLSRLLPLAAALVLCSCGGGGGGGEELPPVGDDGSGGEADVATPDQGNPEEEVGVGPEEEVAQPDICVPDCVGKQCGDDGCGASCGHCYTMEGALNDDLCLEDGSCTPCGCGQQECGNDPCGSPCGNCIGDWVCNAQFLCEPPPIPCAYKGFHDVEQYAKLKQEGAGFTLHFQSVNKAAAPFDVLVMDIDTAKGGPSGPGTYDLAFKDFKTGGIWTYVLKGWNGNGYEYLYVPTAGTIEIVELSSSGGNLVAIIHDGVFEQGSYNAQTEGYNLKADGDIWCLDNIKMDTSLNVTQAVCVEKGTGQALGDNIANFELQRCDGAYAKLHSFCGTKKAIWFVATAGW